MLLRSLDDEVVAPPAQTVIQPEQNGGVGLLYQNLDRPVQTQLESQKIDFTVGVGPPGVKFITLSDNNLTLPQALQGAEKDRLRLGVQEADPGPGRSLLQLPLEGLGLAVDHGRDRKAAKGKGSRDQLHGPVVSGDQDGPALEGQGLLQQLQPGDLDPVEVQVPDLGKRPEADEQLLMIMINNSGYGLPPAAFQLVFVEAAAQAMGLGETDRLSLLGGQPEVEAAQEPQVGPTEPGGQVAKNSRIDW